MPNGSSNYLEYPAAERPPVHVRDDDGDWYPGWLRARRRDDRGWWAFVEYAP